MSLFDDYRANLRKQPSLVRLAIAWILYPEFTVIANIRLLHKLAHGGAIQRLLSKLVWRRLCSKWGCYISPSAVIGARLRLPHPCGIVVGQGVTIGDDVTLYQHVTLGVRTEAAGGYPRIGDGVMVGAGATILGDVRIGDRSVIGAGAVVVSDVPEGYTAIGVPARVRGPGSICNDICARDGLIL